MIYITMDTNFLNISRFQDLSEFRLNADFYRMLELQDNENCIDLCKVLLPDVVYRELVQHECEAYRKAYDMIEKYVEQLGNLVNCRFEYEPEAYEKEIRERADKYIEEEQIELLPVCEEENFAHILEASIKKLPPFEGIKGKADKGFKDAVIWYSLMDYAKKYPGNYIFITNDKIFLENKKELRYTFEEETGTKISFYRGYEEICQNILKFYETQEIPKVEIAIQEKEWEIYHQDQNVMNMNWYLPVVKSINSEENIPSLKYINECIHRYYEDVKDEWMEWKKEAAEEREDPLSEPYSDGVGFEVLLNQNSIFCIRFERYLYTGGWHGIPLWKVMTFDLNTGKLLELKDVMNISETEIYDLAVRRLEEEKKIHSECRPYIAPHFTLKEYHDSSELKWFVDPKGVHIYFDVYEASSYSEGFIQFVLSNKVYKRQRDRKRLLTLENNVDDIITEGCR